MKRQATFLCALIILVAAGLVHGFWAERWNPSTVLQDAAARVDRVPLQIGAWKAQIMDANSAAFFQAGAQSYWTRSYVHSGDKTALLVILMCGRGGRMAVHTPEVCYRGAGYEMENTPQTLVVHAARGADLGTFWTARFSKETTASAGLRLYWGWTASGSWQASSNPRWDYGAEPFLYKLYLSQDAPGTANVASEAALDFMSQFLPELHQTLFDDARPDPGSGGLKATPGAVVHGSPRNNY
jgi:hypothetical protein